MAASRLGHRKYVYRYRDCSPQFIIMSSPAPPASRANAFSFAKTIDDAQRDHRRYSKLSSEFISLEQPTPAATAPRQLARQFRHGRLAARQRISEAPRP